MSEEVRQHERLAQWAKFFVARRGWKIIPIHVLTNGQCSCGKMPCGEIKPGYPAGVNAGKHPYQSRWADPDNAIQDAAGVMTFWDGGGIKTPFNIGLLCGEPSGVVILDVDPRNGGLESLDELETEVGTLPYTLKAVSGGGGLHFYFTMPPGVAFKKGALHEDLPGLDIQTTGSQTLLPPSLHSSGNYYRWADGMNGAEPLAELPDFIVRLAMERGSKGGGGASGTFDYQKLIDSGVSEGSRNNDTYKVACRYLRQHGWEEPKHVQMAAAATIAFNQHFNKPPLDGDEVQLLFGSALAFMKENGHKDSRIPEGVQDWIESQKAAVAQPAPAPVPQPAPMPAPAPMPQPAPVAQPAPVPTPPPVQPADGGGSDGPGDPDDPDDGFVPGDPDQPDDDGNVPPGLPPDNDSLGPDGVPGMRTWTPNGHARRLVDYFGENIRYTPPDVGWFVWREDRKIWRPDEHTVVECSRDLPRHIMSEVVNVPPNQTRAFTDYVDKSRTGAYIDAAMKYGKSDPRVLMHPDAWDADPFLLGVQNGVLDLRTGTLREMRREDHITKQSPITYDPDYRDARFENYLRVITGNDPEMIAWLQRAMGYMLTGAVGMQCFFILIGEPGYGKGTLAEAMMAVLGEYATTWNSDAITQGYAESNINPWDWARTYNRRMLYVDEMPEGERMNEAAVKKISGGSTLTGAEKGKKPFDFDPTAKLIITTNHLPKIRDKGMWRRIFAIPFVHKPPVEDKSLKPWLMNPDGGAKAILTWAVQGAMLWYSEGQRSFGPCEVIEDTTREYKESEDKLGQFLEETVRQGEGMSIKLQDLHNNYRVWAKMTKEWDMPRSTFLVRIKERGFTIEGTSGKAVIHGMALKPQAASNGSLASLAQQHFNYS